MRPSLRLAVMGVAAAALRPCTSASTEETAFEVDREMGIILEMANTVQQQLSTTGYPTDSQEVFPVFGTCPWELLPQGHSTRGNHSYLNNVSTADACCAACVADEHCFAWTLRTEGEPGHSGVRNTLPCCRHCY